LLLSRAAPQYSDRGCSAFALEDIADTFL
jgi:hypothetical protein